MGIIKSLEHASLLLESLKRKWAMKLGDGQLGAATGFWVQAPHILRSIKLHWVVGLPELFRGGFTMQSRKQQDAFFEVVLLAPLFDECIDQNAYVTHS